MVFIRQRNNKKQDDCVIYDVYSTDTLGNEENLHELFKRDTI